MKLWFSVLAFVLLLMGAFVVSFGGAVNAVDLWNSQGYSKVKGAGKYYNSTGYTKQAGRTVLYNSSRSSSSGTKYKTANVRNIVNSIVSYNSMSRSKTRYPQQFAYMSPYAVRNRVNDIDQALVNQLDRRRKTALRLRQAYQELGNSDFESRQQRNREQLVSSMLSEAGYGSAYNNKRSSDGRIDTRGDDKYVTRTEIGGTASSVVNSRSQSNNDGAQIGQKPSLYNRTR